MKRVTIKDKDFGMQEYDKRRQGRPRFEWWKHALVEYWDRIWYCTEDRNFEGFMKEKEEDEVKRWKQHPLRNTILKFNNKGGISKQEQVTLELAAAQGIGWEKLKPRYPLTAAQKEAAKNRATELAL